MYYLYNSQSCPISGKLNSSVANIHALTYDCKNLSEQQDKRHKDSKSTSQIQRKYPNQE